MRERPTFAAPFNFPHKTNVQFLGGPLGRRPLCPFLASQGLIKFISINLPDFLTKGHLGGVILKM
jgi:hypothetical protein